MQTTERLLICTNSLIWCGGGEALCVARPGLCLPYHLPYLRVGSLGECSTPWSGSSLRQSQVCCKYGGYWFTLSGLLLLQEILDGHYTVVGQANWIKAFRWPGSLCRLPGTALTQVPSTVALIHRYQNFFLSAGSDLD